MNYTVYLSSTLKDLGDERESVRQALSDECIIKHSYRASEKDLVTSCLADVAECGAYILILGLRYGYVPEAGLENPRNLSITELEYEHASGKPRFVFIKDEESIPFALTDAKTKEHPLERIQEFRNRVSEQRPAVFKTAEDLKLAVVKAFNKFKEDRAKGTVPAAAVDAWLREYANKLERRFLEHLSRYERLDPGDAHRRYIDVLVRPTPEKPDEMDEARAQPLSDLAAQPGLRILLLGGGGSGKTSLLRKVAVDSCQRALTDPHAPLPFFASLNFFDTHTEVLGGLLKIVAREAELSEEKLAALWSDRTRECLFLFDGLNEVRPEFMGDCRLALQQFMEARQHTCIVTSRPGELATELCRQAGSVRTVEILKLDSDQIKSYLQNAGVGELYERMVERLLSLAQSPFLLWAIVQSCSGLRNRELPGNIGQLYENLIDAYIFGIREVAKPLESRPTRYNYLLVKKPILARLAVEMCRKGATRWPEEAALTSIRDHLRELRDANAGKRMLQPHVFMPEPFANELLDEVVENGIVQRYGATLVFLHESVRDYFAAIELAKCPVEDVLRTVPPLIWRHVEPGYDELPISGILSRALIMSSGLLGDAGDLLQRLVEHNPLLAAHCLASARQVPAETTGDLLQRWLALLDRRLPRYRWVGCQCLRASQVRSREVAHRLVALIRNDPEWEVRKSAARALAAIDDVQITKDLVAEATSQTPEYEYLHDDLGSQFRHLQTDTLIRELLLVWLDPRQSENRKRRVQELFTRMRRSSVRRSLERLAGERHGEMTDTEAAIAESARAILAEIDSWKGGFHAEDIRDMMQFYGQQFAKETGDWIAQMSTWTDANLRRALSETVPPKRGAAARVLTGRSADAVEDLLDAFAREQHGRVAQVLLACLQELQRPLELHRQWERRVLDHRWPLLFSVGAEFAADLEGAGTRERNLGDRWEQEFRRREIDLGSSAYVERLKQGWTIRPGSFGGSLIDNPVFRLASSGGGIEVFDAGLRPRLIRVSTIIGSPAVRVLRELMTEDDEFVRTEVVEALRRIGTPEAIPLLSECIRGTNAHNAIKALGQTRSREAIQPLIDALRDIGPARAFSQEIGSALRALDGVGALLRFAREEGMCGDAELRLATAEALHGCAQPDPNIEALLLTAADDPDGRVRLQAVQGLASIKYQPAERRLVTICLEDTNDEIRAGAGEALRSLDGAAGIPALTAALESSQEKTRIRAAEALARIQDDSAIPSLTKALKSNASLTRIAAGRALLTLGFDYEPLITALVCDARSAPDSPAREAAAKLLCDIPGGADKLYQSIKDPLRAGRYGEAVEVIGSGAPFLPHDVNLYWWRGVAREGLRQYEDALADLDRALALRDCDSIVHRTRAGVLATLNRPADALAAAEKAAEISPSEAENYFLVGWYAYVSNELDKSIAASRRTLELDPKQAMAQFNLGLALLASAQRAEAFDAYTRGLRLCAELDQERARSAVDGASADLEELVTRHPECHDTAQAAKTLIEEARKASLDSNAARP